MSTYVYLRCLDHNPPLLADGESGQHLYDLPQIREDIANRATLVAAAALGVWPHDDHFRANSVRFLRSHVGCHVGIIDEYGVEHDVEADPHPETNRNA